MAVRKIRINEGVDNNFLTRKANKYGYHYNPYIELNQDRGTGYLRFGRGYQEDFLPDISLEDVDYDNPITINTEYGEIELYTPIIKITPRAVSQLDYGTFMNNYVSAINNACAFIDILDDLDKEDYESLPIKISR